MGFETKFGSILNFRFGNTFVYDYYCDYYNLFENKINLGLDIIPYEKLCLYFAAQELLNHRGWIFGLNFAL